MMKLVEKTYFITPPNKVKYANKTDNEKCVHCSHNSIPYHFCSHFLLLNQKSNKVSSERNEICT